MFGLLKWIIRVGIILAIIGGLVHVGILNVAAQEDTSVEQANETKYEFVFSDSLRLVESHWDGKTWIATFEAETPTDVTITDSGRSSDGNQNVVPDRETYTVSSDGTTEIRFSVEEARQVWIEDEHGNYVLKGYDDSIYLLPDGNWTLTGIIVASLLAFLVIVACALMINQLRKNKVERVF